VAIDAAMRICFDSAVLAYYTVCYLSVSLWPVNGVGDFAVGLVLCLFMNAYKYLSLSLYVHTLIYAPFLSHCAASVVSLFCARRIVTPSDLTYKVRVHSVSEVLA
jgi:hypothetical protein